MEIDVPNEVPLDFWKEFRREIKSLNPDAYIVGEIWNDATPWLGGDEFDGVMNYQLRELIFKFIVKREISPSIFLREFENLYFRYPPQQPDCFSIYYQVTIQKDFFRQLVKIKIR